MVEIEQIRKRLAEAIKESGMSQTELAKKLGVSQPTVANYLRGKILPALDTLANLCIILDIDANDILGTK